MHSWFLYLFVWQVAGSWHPDAGLATSQEARWGWRRRRAPGHEPNFNSFKTLELFFGACGHWEEIVFRVPMRVCMHKNRSTLHWLSWNVGTLKCSTAETWTSWKHAGNDRAQRRQSQGMTNNTNHVPFIWVWVKIAYWKHKHMGWPISTICQSICALMGMIFWPITIRKATFAITSWVGWILVRPDVCYPHLMNGP